MNSLQDLRNRKEALKKELEDLENIIKFEDTKKSLSAFTNGFTDNFLGETRLNGYKKLTLKTGNIVKHIGNTIANKKNKDSLVNFDNTNLQSNFIETSLKLGGMFLVSNLAKKSIKGRGWKQKAFGLALTYLLPTLVNYGRKKLDDYQQKQSVKSIEKLI